MSAFRRTKPRARCEVQSCRRPPSRFSNTIYCENHRLRAYRFGHAMHKPLHNRELAAVREAIKAGLAKYQRTTGVQQAVRLADELLAYEAHPNNRSARHMVEQFERLRSHGVNAWDVLQRVSEVYACIAKAAPGRFENSEVERVTLARSVMKLVSLGRYRAEGHMLRTLGSHLQQSLGVFALSFVRRLERDENDRIERIKQSTDFDTEVQSK